MDRPAEDLTVALVRYMESDAGPAEHRVDVIDLRSKATLASLTPDDASAVAVRLLEEALRARARSTAPPATEPGA